MPEEEIGPTVLPELSSNVIQTILEINAALIKVCVEFQNKGWTSDPDFAIYQARLQSNLAYLAAVADHYLKPERKTTDLPPKPNLTPLPDPRTVSAEMLKKLVAKARHDFEGVDNSSRSEILQRDAEAGRGVELDIKRREEHCERTLILERSAEPVKLAVPQPNRIIDPPLSSEQYQTYEPFPPLQLPDGVANPLIPPNLPKIPFESEDDVDEGADPTSMNETVESEDREQPADDTEKKEEAEEQPIVQETTDVEIKLNTSLDAPNPTTEQVQESDSQEVPSEKPIPNPSTPPTDRTQISLISELIEQISGQNSPL